MSRNVGRPHNQWCAGHDCQHGWRYACKCLKLAPKNLPTLSADHSPRDAILPQASLSTRVHPYVQLLCLQLLCHAFICPANTNVTRKSETQYICEAI